MKKRKTKCLPINGKTGNNWNKRFWVLVIGLSLFSCRSSFIPNEGRVSPTHSEVTGEVEFILIKKDGVTIILPTITKDTIK